MFSLTSIGQETFENIASQFDRFEAKLLTGIPKQDLAVSRGVLRFTSSAETSLISGDGSGSQT